MKTLHKLKFSSQVKCFVFSFSKSHKLNSQHKFIKDDEKISCTYLLKTLDVCDISTSQRKCQNVNGILRSRIVLIHEPVMLL